MARWHDQSCSSPRVWIDKDSVPQCSTCGSSAHQQLQNLVQSPNPIPPVPPNEPAGKLNLSWPSTVSYTRANRDDDRSFDPIDSQSATSTRQPLQEKAESPHSSAPAKHEPGSPENLLGVYGDTLKVDQFRLIRLTDNDNNLPDDVVHVSLETFQDEKSPEYEAVSYSWGGEDGNDVLRHPIYIGDYWDILPQTQNCREMISYLRPLNGIRMLWVDAICINQQNLEERSNQVAKMGRIYSECFQVVLWLGQDVVSKRPTGHSSRHRFQQLQGSTLTLPSKNGKQVTIQEILKRRYFSRVWVIQELILPPRILIPLGDKTFWVGSSMNADLEHQTNGSWSWEKTNAPWFQLATKGMLSNKSVLDMLSLSWKSQSSDARDKIFGIIGPLALNPGVSSIRPDYSISLQHTLIGLFSHLIINEKSPQQLFKASGASANADMPSWMPRWEKSVTWQDLFGSETKANPSWDTVKESLMDCVIHTRISLNKPLLPGIRLVRFLAVPPSETGGVRSAFDVRPWYKDATVDANSGSLTLYLTRLFPICRVLISAGPTHTGWYSFSVGDSRKCFVYLMSQSRLDTVVEIEDIIFFLDTNVSEPIYLILRKTNDNGEYRLIATCSHLVLQTLGLDNFDPEIVPVAYLQTSLAEDLTKLHAALNESLYMPDFAVHKYCFPGMEGDFLLRDALPLYLGLANDRYRKKLKTGKTFEHAYLSFLDPEYQPRITDGICELLIGSKEADKLPTLVSGFWASVAYTDQWQPWEKRPSTEDKSRVILRRSVTAIKFELEELQRRWPGGRTKALLRAFLKMLENKDIEERIMEKPRAEDYFRGGSHFGYNTPQRFSDDDMYQRFQLDGSTCQVRIS